MKKVFVMTPFMYFNIDPNKRYKAINTEIVNTYIRRAVDYFKAWTGFDDDDFEVTTNFFLEPNGTDTDGETIYKIHNSDSLIKYFADELKLIAEADMVLYPEEQFYSEMANPNVHAVINHVVYPNAIAVPSYINPWHVPANDMR